MSDARTRHARDAALRILDRAGLRTYLVEVSASPGGFRIEIELPRDGGWAPTTLEIDEATLLDSLRHPARRDDLAARWGELLAA